MKAVRIHQFGGPDVLRLEDIPEPSARDDEVVLKVHAASVNPVDYKIRQGAVVGQDKLPMTLGRDLSGTVASCGPAASAVRVGDAVYAMLSPEHGAFAEYAVARAGELAAKPRRLDHTAAAGVPLAALTAWQGLFDYGGLGAGQRVLIHGAAGGVGHFAVQFARAKGAEVVATAASQDLDFVRGLGAATVVDFKAQRFEDFARDIDVVFDLIGGETQDRSWAVLKPGGIIVSTLAEPDQERARGQGARGANFHATPNGAQLAEIGRLIDAGEVRVEVTGTLPLAAAAEAQSRLERDHPRGKMVLTVSG